MSFSRSQTYQPKPLEIVILAAGKGTRMYSDRPKVLHCLAGYSLIEHVLCTCEDLHADKIHIVHGFGSQQLQQHLQHKSINWVEQKQQLGTGHAVQQVLPHLQTQSDVLILYADVPLISQYTLRQMRVLKKNCDLVLLTMEVDNPEGYGRIVRDKQHQISKIVEQKDADQATLSIREINSGIMLVGADKLSRWLQNLSNDNSQHEFYLTDIVARAVAEKTPIATYKTPEPMEIQGINSKQQLSELERYFQLQQAQELLHKGVTLRDPARLDIRGTLQTGRDVEIDVNVIFEGNNKLGNKVKIGANCMIINSTIGDQVTILPNSIIENSVIDSYCTIGPFARLRPQSHLQKNAKIGNFVEVKKSTIGEGSKVNHLSYIGDTHMGEQVNIGAGTITCNYDGANKHQSKIGNHVFVGSNTALVAPINIAADVTIGAGSTLSKDVTAACLVVARGKAREIKHWQRPVKKKIENSG